MRKWLLVILLLFSVFYFATDRFVIQSGHQSDGKYQLALIDKTNGKIYHVLGK